MNLARREVPIPAVPDSEPWYNGIFDALAALSFLLTGGLLTIRLPRHVLARLLLVAGFGYALHLFALAYTYLSYLVATEPLPLSAAMFGLAAVGLSLLLPSIPLILLLFPSGRLPSPRWRFAYWYWAGFVVIFGGLSWLSPSGKWVPFENPLAQGGGIGAVVDVLSGATWFSLLVMLALAAISTLVRALRARGLERQQFKWLVVAALGYLVSVPLVATEASWVHLVYSLAGAGVPLAIAFAVARYRLWDIDVVIRRTTVYTILTLVLATVYFGSVVALQRLLSPFTGKSTAAVVLSTLLIAALFLPLRRRVQQVIDHRFFRTKYNAALVLERFAATVRDETDLDALTGELVKVIRETMQPERVSVWLQPARADQVIHGAAGETAPRPAASQPAGPGR